MNYDAVIVGGGLIGAACADSLAGEGLSVCLLEAGPFCRESSWAGAGVLHPIHPWNYPAPLHPLLRRAAAEHVRIAPQLAEDTGIDPCLARSGLLVMGEDRARLAAWCGDEIEHRRVEACAEEPAIRGGGPALLIPDAYHVKSHRLAAAYRARARQRGAVLCARRPATQLAPGRVETAAGPVRAERTVLCAGAWAGQLWPAAATEPVRGQILLYKGQMRRMVIFPAGEYAVPRRDGHILFGSTLEHVGFDARPTEEACTRLAARAEALLGLDGTRLVAVWAGLRPGTRHLLPYLGADPRRPDLLHASGHYRNGILLAPLTARLLTDLVVGRQSETALKPFEMNL